MNPGFIRMGFGEGLLSPKLSVLRPHLAGALVVILVALLVVPVPVAAQEFAPGEVCVEQQIFERINVFNALPETNVTVVVDSVITQENLQPGDLGPLGTGPGFPTDFEIIDSDTDVVLVEKNDFILDDLTTLMVVVDSNGDVDVTALPDPLQPLSNGTALIGLRYVGSVDEADYQIQETLGAVKSGNASSVGVVAGPITVRVVIEGSDVPNLGTFDTREGEAHLFTVYESPTGLVQVAKEVIFVGFGPVANAEGTCVLLEFCGQQEATVSLAAGETPTDGDDVIVGTDGDDVIAAGDGADLICGGDGNDIIWGQGGDDTIWGELGDDRLRGGPGNDDVYGGEGADSVTGGPDDDVVDGEEGDDIEVRGNTGDDTVRGGPGNDLLVAGNGGSDTVFGGPGDDVKVTGGPRPDVVDGGSGNDLVKGNKGADQLTGGTGDDELFGGPQPDQIDGGEGTDTCSGGTTGGEPPAVEGDVAQGCEGDLVAIP